MKQDLKIVLFLAVVILLSAITGYFLVGLFKYLGANMVTIKDVAACYFFSFLAYLLFGVWLLMKKKP